MMTTTTTITAITATTIAVVTITHLRVIDVTSCTFATDRRVREPDVRKSPETRRKPEIEHVQCCLQRERARLFRRLVGQGQHLARNRT